MIPQKKEKYKIIFIIINWNKKDILNDCLNSIKAHISYPYKIIIIDNGSSDGSQQMIKLKHSDTVLIENKKNLGFSRANNQGLRIIKENNFQFDYVIFLNNDAALKDNSIEKLIDYLDKNPEVKAAIPAVFLKNGSFQTGIGGYELSLRTAFSYFFLLSNAWPQCFKGFFILQKYFRKKGLILELEWISGVCFVTRNDIIGQIPGFPEDFFMYAEDLALCRDIRRFGKIIYYPFAQVYHMKQDSFFDPNCTMWLDSLFQYYRMSRKQQAVRLTSLLLKLIFLCGFLIRLIGYSILPFKTKNAPKKTKELAIYCVYILKNLFS